MKIDPTDLVDATDVAHLLGLKYRNTVHDYVRRYGNFPPLVYNRRRVMLWSKPEIIGWAADRAARRVTTDHPHPADLLVFLTVAYPHRETPGRLDEILVAARCEKARTRHDWTTLDHPARVRLLTETARLFIEIDYLYAASPATVGRAFFDLCQFDLAAHHERTSNERGQKRANTKLRDAAVETAGAGSWDEWFEWAATRPQQLKIPPHYHADYDRWLSAY